MGRFIKLITLQKCSSSKTYRASQTHRGDIEMGFTVVLTFLQLGTPVNAVASGVVVRADHNYKEVPADLE